MVTRRGDWSLLGLLLRCHIKHRKSLSWPPRTTETPPSTHAHRAVSLAGRSTQRCWHESGAGPSPSAASRPARTLLLSAARSPRRHASVQGPAGTTALAESQQPLTRRVPTWGSDLGPGLGGQSPGSSGRNRAVVPAGKPRQGPQLFTWAVGGTNTWGSCVPSLLEPQNRTPVSAASTH